MYDGKHREYEAINYDVGKKLTYANILRGRMMRGVNLHARVPERTFKPGGYWKSTEPEPAFCL